MVCTIHSKPQICVLTTNLVGGGIRLEFSAEAGVELVRAMTALAAKLKAVAR